MAADGCFTAGYSGKIKPPCTRARIINEKFRAKSARVVARYLFSLLLLCNTRPVGTRNNAVNYGIWDVYGAAARCVFHR